MSTRCNGQDPTLLSCHRCHNSSLKFIVCERVRLIAICRKTCLDHWTLRPCPVDRCAHAHRADKKRYIAVLASPNFDTWSHQAIYLDNFTCFNIDICQVKCEGANSPPCQRCLKDGRICITPARSQPSAAYEELTPATSISSELPVEPSTELLSIYSASPVSHIAALGLSNADSTPQQHGRHERAEIPQGLLSRQDLIDLLIV